MPSDQRRREHILVDEISESASRTERDS